MNVFKKLTALLLSSAAVFGCLAGCRASNDPNTLYIDAFEGGYGVKWLYALGEEFEKKNEGITVKINETSDDSTFSTMLTFHGGHRIRAVSFLGQNFSPYRCRKHDIRSYSGRSDGYL